MTTLSIEFCQIEMPGEADTTFCDLIRSAMDLEGLDRAFRINDAYIRLQGCSFEENFVCGELVRLRMTDFQDIIGTPDGSIEYIPLSGTRRMGLLTAFLFHIETRVLLIHRTRSGVLIPSMTKYFQNIGGLNHPISAYPLIKSSAIADIERMRTVRRFNFRVAGMTNPGAVFSGNDEALGTIRRMSSILKAPLLEMSVSVGRLKKESLDKEGVINFANILNSLRAKTVEHRTERIGPEVIQVYGTDDDESSLMVDLIRDRVAEKINIAIGEPRPLTYQERLDALKRAWSKNSDEIQKIYGSRD